jgi:hypothetical protein
MACTICTSAKLPDIDEALLNGGKIIPVGEQFGFTKSVVHRHRSRCLVPRLKAASRMTAEGMSLQPAAPAPAEPVKPAQPAPTRRTAKAAAPTRPNISKQSKRVREIATGTVAPTPADVVSVQGLLGVWGGMIGRLEGAAARADEAGSFSGLAALANSMARSLEGVARLQGLYKEPEAEGKAPGFTINIHFPDNPVGPATPSARKVSGVQGGGHEIDAAPLTITFGPTLPLDVEDFDLSATDGCG